MKNSIETWFTEANEGAFRGIWQITGCWHYCCNPSGKRWFDLITKQLKPQKNQKKRQFRDYMETYYYIVSMTDSKNKGYKLSSEQEAADEIWMMEHNIFIFFQYVKLKIYISIPHLFCRRLYHISLYIRTVENCRGPVIHAFTSSVVNF